MDGRTYGCHVLGLRVVSYRGSRMRPLGALLRAVFCVFFPIGLLWCAASRANRSVQDVVLRTSVVYDWEPGSPVAAPTRGSRESGLPRPHGRPHVTCSSAEIGHLGAPDLEGEQVLALLGVVVIACRPDARDRRPELLIGGTGPQHGAQVRALSLRTGR